MKVFLDDGTTYQAEKVRDTWVTSEINKNGDLTLYRMNPYVLAPMPIANFAAGTWTRTEL